MFNEVFHQQRDISAWTWKFRDNPYGSYFISLGIAEDGTLATQFSGYPAVFCIYAGNPEKAEEILTLQLGDKMTRKRFRSVGFGRNSIMNRTYRHFRDFYTKDRMPFCYGFAAGHSLRFGTVVMGYVDIEPVPYRKLSLKEIPLGAPSFIAKLGRLLSSLRVEPVTEVSDEWTTFFHKAAPAYSCLIRKDARYVKWRYFDRPDKKYVVLAVRKGGRLSGWAVFYRQGLKIIWGDALFLRGEAISTRAILDYVRRTEFGAGADSIECWFPPRPDWWHDLLNRMGFQMEAEPNNLHFTAPILNDTSMAELLRTDFYYTIGDSDLF